MKITSDKMDRISKFIEDQSFINWIFHPNSDLDLKWKIYQQNNPEEKDNIALAQKVLQKFRAIERDLSQQEKILIFSKILKEVEQKETRKTKLILTWQIAKYAAIAILFFAIGALVFYQQDITSPYFAQLANQQTENYDYATLIRPDGNKIMLKSKKAKLDFTKDAHPIINGTKKIHPSIAANKFSRLVVPYGQFSELQLSDGSKVYLSAGSQLMFPEKFEGSTRQVLLEGEAFFKVSKDKKHPFIVQTTNMSIEVKGTCFNVSAYAENNVIETVLAEGLVSIRNNITGVFDTDAVLKPGQKAVFDKLNQQLNMIVVDVEEYTLWTEGMLKFNSSNLLEIARKLERYYDIRFSFSKSSLKQLKISGKLDLIDNVDEMVDLLANTASVRITKKANNIYEID